jgi:hypothetical protein
VGLQIADFPAPAESIAPRAATTVDDIPDVRHPKWQQLMNGDLRVDVKALDLQMLLARIRTMVLLDLSEDEKRAWLASYTITSSSIIDLCSMN